MCLRLWPHSPRPPSWLKGSLLLRDGEGKEGGEKRREGNWKGREAWEGKGKGKEGSVGARRGAGREGKGDCFETVAPGGGPQPKCGPGPPATLRWHCPKRYDGCSSSYMVLLPVFDKCLRPC